MSTILSPTEYANLSGDISNVFDTMSLGRFIVVFKDPLKVPINNAPAPNSLFGFGDSQPDITYNNVPVSGIFPAIIKYASIPPNPLDPEINVRIYSGPTMIKVKQDCRDYIQNGKTDHIVADGKAFLIDGEEKRQMFLNNVFYLYNLKAVT